MTRVSFMMELESLLSNISSEERENALRYYEDYFEDAGIEKEADIITELGSPKRVAEIILLELNNGMHMNESGGIYTENGYKNTIYGDDKYEVINPSIDKASEEEGIHLEFDSVDDKKTKDYHNFNNQYSNDNSYEYNSNDNSFEHNDRSFNKSSYGTNKGDNRYGDYYRDPYYKNPSDGRETRRRKSNLWLIILLAIFAIPIGLPVLIAVVAVVFSVGITILSLFFGIGALSIGLLIGGIVTVVAGIIVLFSMPVNGILVSGIGLILVGLGIIFSLLSYQLIKAIVPRVIRGIVNILRRPFHRKSAIA